MATTVSGVYYPDSINSENNPPADGKKAGESLDGKINMKFNSIAERDAWLSTLPSAKRAGTKAWVNGKGVFVYDGANWLPISMRGYTYVSGHMNVGTNEAGLFSIPHGLGVSALIPDVHVLYSGNLAQLSSTRIVYREFQLNNLVCMAINTSNNQGKANELMIVSYRLEIF